MRVASRSMRSALKDSCRTAQGQATASPRAQLKRVADAIALAREGRSDHGAGNKNKISTERPRHRTDDDEAQQRREQARASLAEARAKMRSPDCRPSFRALERRRGAAQAKRCWTRRNRSLKM